jgi:GNAT superfamily N-acetyltransferase
MRIFDEPMDQCLLCIGYDFHQDAPIFREAARNRFEPGVSQKEWWRYQHNYLGLRTLVAYDGSRPVGHVEFIPIQHAPRPVSGARTLFINCLFVDRSARFRGVGRALLEAAEEEATRLGKGIAVLAYESGSFMPAAFFEACGFEAGEARDGERLLHKASFTGETPSFLPLHYEPRRNIEGIAVDYFHCPQCPRSGTALQELQGKLASRRGHIDLRVINTGQRPTIEQWGIAQGIFVDGHRLPIVLPPHANQLKSALESLLGEAA